MASIHSYIYFYGLIEEFFADEMWSCRFIWIFVLFCTHDYFVDIDDRLCFLIFISI